MATGERLICVGAELEETGLGLRFEVNWHGRPTPAFAIRYRGRVHAYLNRCTHVPVELDWQAGQFFDYSRLYLICTVHGALFDPVTGACLGGRCEGRGLQPLPVEERDGMVYLKE